MLSKSISRLFSHSGPYNPNRYRSHLAPRSFPKDKEIEDYYQAINSIPISPTRNMKHINPIRQSGPLPPYDGPYTMEDIKKIHWNTTIGRDFNYCSTDPEEIMRRVPGITRKEAEHITRLGLSPDEEVDYAYIAYNIGLDVFYKSNGVYVARQVVTNSKGEKTEVYWNAQAFEELSFVPVGNAPIIEMPDYTWEIFLWGEPAIHPLVDFDLCVPATWFEYEEENWNEMNIQEDQYTLPDNLRKKSDKHPNSSKELWRSQEDWERILKMKNPDWTPEGLTYNVYNEKDFVRNSPNKE